MTLRARVARGGVLLVAPSVIALAGCSSGGSDGDPIVVVAPAELVSCRVHIKKPHTLTEIQHSTVSGLRLTRLTSRVGREIHVRVHPNGNRIVFARERESGKPDSREIFLAFLDRSQSEKRLTGNTFVDDSPCWSEDGGRILFSSTVGGRRHLWQMDPDGTNLRQLTSGDVDDRDPDAGGGFIYFSREQDVSGQGKKARIFRMDPSGVGPTALTDGGTVSGAGLGDREPAISPDTKTLVFSRIISRASRAQRSLLMSLQLGSKTPSVVGDGGGEDRYARWSPQGDRLLVARSRPLAGLPGLRLYTMATNGVGPLLVYPDLRFEYQGFDPLRGFPAYGGTGPGGPVEPDFGQVVVKAGGISRGLPRNMRTEDGVVFGVATGVFQGREVAGIELPLKLPSAPGNLAEIAVVVRAAITRTDSDSFLRIGLYNPVEDRFDTVVEMVPADTKLHTYRFATQSLAHIDTGGHVRLQVVADLSPGARAELVVDLMQISEWPRPCVPPPGQACPAGAHSHPR